MKQTNRKSAYLHSLRTRIDVAALMENTRRIFGRAQEANLSSRWVFLNVLAGHKNSVADRMWPADHNFPPLLSTEYSKETIRLHKYN